MHAAGLPWPGIVVSAEDIHAGKPDPECYLLALRRLGQSPDSAVVFEDAPAGLAAGHAAGCRTIAVAACATEQALAGEDWLPDLSRLTLAGIGLIVFAKRGRDKPIPFGPYLAAAGLIALLYGTPLSRLTLGLAS